MQIKTDISGKIYANMTNKQNKYIVIHYTGNPNTSARNNALYLSNNKDSVSAHYTVDEKEIYKILDHGKAAFHCGGPVESSHHPYRYICTNYNSIGIEICCIQNDKGPISYLPETINNAINLTAYIMIGEYIPITNVIRHYDVTGKDCPRNFDFDNFKKELRKMINIYEEVEHLKNEIERLKTAYIHNEKIYHYFDELKQIGDNNETYNLIMYLYNKGIYKGKNPGDLNLTETMRRILLINSRAGIYGKII